MSCDCGDNCPCKTKEKVEQEQYRGRYEVGHSNLGTSSMPTDGRLNPTSTGAPKSLHETDKKKVLTVNELVARDLANTHTVLHISGDRATLLRVYNGLLQSCIAYKTAILGQETGE